MKTFCPVRRNLRFSAAAVLASCLCTVAVQAQPMPDADMPNQGQGFDWMHHTQYSLAELKEKLNLKSGQLPDWEAWSLGVLKDAQLQLESTKDMREQRRSGEGQGHPVEASTPEQMSRGIARLHAEIDWQQRHLMQLEAAQARTSTFYETLDTNQKTIFDLFWHEMYHRSAGHDDGRAEDAHAGEGLGLMDRSHDVQVIGGKLN
jgi:GAF domain-containing protein